MNYAIPLATCAALGLAIGSGSAAAAQPPAKKPVVVTRSIEPPLPTRRVGYADLNLASASGAKMLYRRVGHAVASVCLESLGLGVDFYEESSCRGHAWRGARPQMDRAILRAREMAATGSSNVAAAAITVSASD